MRKKLIGFALIISFLFTACAALTPAPLTDKEYYLQALAVFNDSIESYYNMRDALEPEAREKIENLIFKASDALDAWDRAITEGIGIPEKQEAYRFLRLELFGLLLKHNIIEVK